MATIIEVHSLEKNCQVLINLDFIVEIAPLTNGTCEIIMNDGSASTGARSKIRVSDGYDLFKQFAMHTITAEDIDKRFPKVTKKPRPEKDRHEISFDDIPKL